MPQAEIQISLHIIFANSLMQADSEFNLHGQTLMHPKMIILDANELKQVYF